MEELEYLCVWAWKRRSGWMGGRASSLLGVTETTSKKLWEYRSLVVCGHTLSYYETGREDSEAPRGAVDLWTDQVSFQIQLSQANAPTPFQMTIQAKDPAVEWKFCFEQQDDLMRLSGALNRILDQGGVFQSLAHDRFEHAFVKGDHLYRWEMIVCPPVIYPIQIHGIVLEAGRNCLVVADFGLTGYAKKAGSKFHHSEDNEDTAVDKKILASWRKLRPKDQTQRLNILTLTNPTDIRKWVKAGYDEESMMAKAKAAGHGVEYITKMGKGVGKMSKEVYKGASKGASAVSKAFQMTISKTESQDQQEQEEEEEGDGDGEPRVSALFDRLATSSSSSPSPSRRSASKTESSTEEQEQADSEQMLEEAIDEVLTTGEQPAHTEEPTSPHAAAQDEKEDNSVPQKDHNEQEEEAASSAITSKKDFIKQMGEKAKMEKKLEELPQSDPVEIVLARANFVLEHMEVLPPYHVFFSNSECIAVWCKTGRWSTLQTAVWCSTNSVGAFKTSTLTTIGVAAANPLLAPVIAIGGLLWVSAPMVILQKSRAKWEEFTKLMTEMFWDWAPPIVYVSAIQNWTTILQQQQQQQQSLENNTIVDEYIKDNNDKTEHDAVILSIEEKDYNDDDDDDDTNHGDSKKKEEEDDVQEDTVQGVQEDLAAAFSLSDEEKEVKTNMSTDGNVDSPVAAETNAKDDTHVQDKSKKEDESHSENAHAVKEDLAAAFSLSDEDEVNDTGQNPTQSPEQEKKKNRPKRIDLKL